MVGEFSVLCRLKTMPCLEVSRELSSGFASQQGILSGHAEHA